LKTDFIACDDLYEAPAGLSSGLYPALQKVSFRRENAPNGAQVMREIGALKQLDFVLRFQNEPGVGRAWESAILLGS
jgi:hypothetical protein